MGYEQFTEDARSAMQAANQQAKRVGHEYIGTDDFLIGIAAGPNHTVADVLRRHDITVPKLRACLRHLPRMEGSEAVGNPRAKDAVANAMARARDLHHLEINSAHLLLGILDCTDSDGCRALAEAGANVEQMKLDILRQLSAGPPAEAARRRELEQRFKDHPEVVSLNQQIDQLQKHKEDAIVNRDFEQAALDRDQQVSLGRSLWELYKKLGE